eukprot:EG_transcript_60294
MLRRCLIALTAPRLYDPKDVVEKLVRGSGPGGQATNKTSNCVFLRHVPTNLTVKCHATRSVELNRRTAYQILNDKLDVHFNGAAAAVAQKKARLLQRSEN